MAAAKKFLAAAWAIGMLSGVVWADGMIVPIRPEIRVRGSWAVKYHRVNMVVRDQVATVTVDQEFVNTGAGMIEVEYLFPVPPQAAIDGMTLLVNGKEFKAELLKADEARKIYEDIVRRKKDPALLEYAGFGLLKTSAFPLEAGKPARVVVNYKSTCKKDADTVEVWYPLNTEKFSARPIEEVQVTVDIKGRSPILAPYSPTHKIDVQPKGPGHVVVSYTERNALPAVDFQVFYKETDKDVGATLLTHQPAGKDGFFLMLVSPNPQATKDKATPKDMVVVLDHSGSMAGPKLQQAQEALAFILNNLNKDDRFSVIVYNDLVDAFSDGLVDASPGNVKQALDRLDRVEASGGTNLHDALVKAMETADNRGVRDIPDRPAYVIFLTDGLPTVGKTEEKEIAADARAANRGAARLFAFGVGYDANARLLDKLADENAGRSDYVKPAEPVEVKISSLYRKIRNPVMTNIQVRIEGLKLRDMYPRQVGDLFEGDQLVLVGRYDCRDAGASGWQSQLVVTGKYEGKERGFEYPVTIQPAGRRGYEFVEKLWATRRIGYLLDQIQQSGQSKELVDEIVRLSRDYGIMTPYTSFLAEERTPLAKADSLRTGAGSLIARDSAEVSGPDAQRWAMNLQGLKEASGAPATASKPMAGPGGTYAGGTTSVLGHSDRESYEGNKLESTANVRQIGNQAVYRRGDAWVTAEAAKLQDAKPASVQTIERFSEEYFKLVRRNTVEENQILASQQAGEELLVSLRGQLYQIK